MAPAYIAGLIGPGERKSVQPLAERLGAWGYDRLHHFTSSASWESGPLEAALWREGDALLGGEEAFLIVDDTAPPKKGTRSVGVGPQ